MKIGRELRRPRNEPVIRREQGKMDTRKEGKKDGRESERDVKGTRQD